MTTDPRVARSPAASASWHALEVEETLRRLASNPGGLSGAEAQQRLKAHGPNALTLARPPSALDLARAQLTSVVALLLAVVTLVSLLTGDTLEAAAVAAVLVLNSTIGFWTEWKARLAMHALHQTQLQDALVLRDGTPTRIDAKGLVPGDVIQLTAGDAVPADARVLVSEELSANEAPLTGESFPVTKQVEPVGDPADGDAVALADRSSMVYKGTVITSGSGRVAVAATGVMTEIGRVAELVGSVEDPPAPIETRLDALARRLIVFTLGVAALVAVAGALRGGEPWLMVRTGLALAIAAVPEGLPVVATVTLAVGMARLARRRALVRRLSAVESLGSVTVVCSDKTGTLTTGEMTATALWLDGFDLEVTGGGYRPEGELRSEGAALSFDSIPNLERLLTTAALANRATLREDAGDGPAIEGDPTEAALLVVAAKAGIRRERLLATHPEAAHIPFSSGLMWMATVHEAPGGLPLVCLKGAPDRVIEGCSKIAKPDGDAPLDAAARDRIEQANRALATRALRVLAVAVREASTSDVPDAESVFSDLTFLGLVGLRDTVAPGATETVTRLREAGVRTVMITGDQATTAAAIAAELGIGSPGDRVLQGAEVGRAAAAGTIDRTSVFARVTPEDKLGIVETLQGQGDLVAMLGDGVNDAPALKRADVGVAMGRRGTDVARETADVVLLDDRFETIGVAVEQGRVIFDNVRKFVFYLFSCNLAEVGTVFAATMAGLPLPLQPIQILWLNLITDVFPALALAMEPAEPGVMRRPPRDPQAALLSRGMLGSIALYGALLTVSVLAVFVWALGTGTTQRASTLAFLTLALAQGAHALNARTEGPLRAPHVLTNPWLWSALVLVAALMVAAVHHEGLAGVLGTVPVGRADWGVVLLASLFPLAAGQVWKRRPRVAPYPRSPTPSEE